MPKKESPNKDLYIYSLPYNELILHSGLDRIELSFDGFDLPEFWDNKWHVWTTTLFFWGQWYHFIYQISNYKGFQYSIDLKYDYKGYKFEAIKIMIGNKSPVSTFKNKIIIEGKFLRFSNIENFQFTTRDILDFLDTHFVGLKVMTFDYCMDIQIDQKYPDFLGDVYFEAYRLRTIWHKNFKPVTPAWITEYIYDGDIDSKKNDVLYWRYYDKKIEIAKEWTKDIYLSYIENPNHIFRFELNFRKTSTQNITFQDLYKEQMLFSIFHTKLESKGILIFKETLDFEKTLIKRQTKQKNKLKWWSIYKLDTLWKINQAKGVISQLDRMEKAGIDILWMKQDKQILDISQSQEYAMYYVWMLDGITEFFMGIDNVFYVDFKKEIEGHIEYIEATCGIPYSEFLNHVKWYIDTHLEYLFDHLSIPIICLVDLYFIEKIHPEEDKIFEFLKIFKDEEIMSFCKKDIKTQLRRIKRDRTYELMFQTHTHNDANTALKIVSFVTKTTQYVSNN